MNLPTEEAVAREFSLRLLELIGSAKMDIICREARQFGLVRTYFCNDNVLMSRAIAHLMGISKDEFYKLERAEMDRSDEKCDVTVRER